MDTGTITGEAAGGMSGEIRKGGKEGWGEGRRRSQRTDARQRKKRAIDPRGDFNRNTCFKQADGQLINCEIDCMRNKKVIKFSQQ